MHLRYAVNDVSIDGESVRTESLHGDEYVVAPVVLVQEMVLNGGFAPWDEIARSAPGWNGRPVTLNHPTNESGEFVSANSPDVHEKTVFGRVFNVDADNDAKKLRGELWIHRGIATRVGDGAQTTVNRLESGDALEVSTGYFMRPIPQPGTHNGDAYDQVQTDIMPDHLAALPDGTGACSVEDGCGAPRLNAIGADATYETDADTMFAQMRHFARTLTGQSCGCDACTDNGNGNGNGGDPGESERNETPEPMTEKRTFLIDNTAMTEDDVSDLSDEQVERMYETYSELAEQAQATNNDDGGDDDDDPTGTDNDDGDGTLAEEVLNRLDSLEQRLEDQEQSERDDLIDTIEANTSHDRETLEQIDNIDVLETMADEAEPTANENSGFPVGGPNYAGRPTGDRTSSPEGQDADAVDVPIVLGNELDDGGDD
jgi:hypothetical protein